MGLFGLTRATKSPLIIEAQKNPQVRGDSVWWQVVTTPVTRAEAMSVPAIARCRNLIVGVPATSPLQLKRDDQELPNPLWLDQPSASQARAVTMAWTFDSLFFYGISFWQITEIYADDGRPARFRWVDNQRVSANYNKNTTEVIGYYVDGENVPMSGLNSLVTFQALDEGILSRGGNTIRAAIDLQKAARIAAASPMPAGVLKNNGAELSDGEVQGILSAWRTARSNNSIAYVSASLDFNTQSFSPKDMMYVEAIQNMALECARMCNIEAADISAETTRPMTYSNIQDKRRDFVANSLQPYISAVEDRLSMEDITPRGQEVRIDLDETFLRANALDRLTVIEKLLTLGLIDIPTAQDMEDLAPSTNEISPTPPIENEGATTP